MRLLTEGGITIRALAKPEERCYEAGIPQATVRNTIPVPLLHIFVLALVQGITEFLPISSSGHLVLVPALTGWADQGLLIDVAVHVGTLGAVLVYFRRDVLAMAIGFLHILIGRSGAPRRLAFNVVIGTIPVVIAGFVLHAFDAAFFRSVEVIAWATLGFGIVLWLADRFSMAVKTVAHMKYGDALLIGLSQMLALIPGTSRSGITMTAARMLGYERTEAARFSMLISIPAILGAGLLAGKDLYDLGDLALGTDALIAAGLAFVSALAAIALMMRWLKTATFTPFAVYRIILGGGLLIWLSYA